MTLYNAAIRYDSAILWDGAASSSDVGGILHYQGGRKKRAEKKYVNEFDEIRRSIELLFENPSGQSVKAIEHRIQKAEVQAVDIFDDTEAQAYLVKLNALKEKFRQYWYNFILLVS